MLARILDRISKSMDRATNFSIGVSPSGRRLISADFTSDFAIALFGSCSQVDNA